MKSTELSPERLALFEKLYEAEREVVRFGRNFEPPELARQEDLTAYRSWRHWNKEVPRIDAATLWLREKWTREAAEKSAAEAPKPTEDTS